MNDELTKITLTFPLHYGTSNRNGTVYTKEAIDNAFAVSRPHIPIVVQCGTSREDEFAYPISHCVGMTDKKYCLEFDDKNQVCHVTLNGYMYDMGADIVINEMDDGKITDFDIKSIDIFK